MAIKLFFVVVFAVLVMTASAARNMPATEHDDKNSNTVEVASAGAASTPKAAPVKDKKCLVVGGVGGAVGGGVATVIPILPVLGGVGGVGGLGGAGGLGGLGGVGGLGGLGGVGGAGGGVGGGVGKIIP